MSRLSFALALLLCLPPALPAAPPPEQWIVVTAPAFRKAVEPLCEQRKAQGFRVVVVQTTDVLGADEIRKGEAAKLRDHLHKLCRDHRGPSSILLVGAIEGSRLEDAEKKVLPSCRGSVGRMKGQPSDNAYGCPAGGRLPSVPVGRFPARSEQEAKDMVAKTLRYENDRRPDPWRRRLTILAGVPAYNPLVDRVVESLAFSRLDRLDPSWTGRALYTNPQSRFCVPDARLHARALRYVQEGQAFILYLGHSSPEGLYAGNDASFLDRADWGRLRIERGSGVFFTTGCNGCQLGGKDGEGYGIAAVRNPQGPAAVIGPHAVSYAAMGLLASDGLFESALAGRLPERLGTTWLAVERGVAQGKIDALTYGMLDAVDGDSSIPQATQRQEHLEMFVLLGDPALRLPAVPADVELKAESVQPGKPLAVRGRVPARLAGARVRLTLERTVGSVPDDLETLPGGAGRDRVMLANHEKANRFVLAATECPIRDGAFEARLDLPAKLPWPRVLLRAYAATDTEEGQTVLPLEVGKPAKVAPSPPTPLPRGERGG
jgi:hypothetical protein